MRSLAPGPLFLGALVVVAALQIVDLQLTEASYREDGDYGDIYFGDDRVVTAVSVLLRPGERLLVHHEVPGASPWLFSSYDLHIAPGGARYAFLAGEPVETYHDVRAIALSPCCSGGLVAFERPHGAPLETPPAATVPPDQAAHFELLSEAERVDLVWVFHYLPGVERPTDPEELRAFQTRIYHDMSRTPPMPLRDVVVWGEPILQARPVIDALNQTAIFAASAAAIWWVVRFHRARAAAPAPGAEGLLELHAAAGGFLARVRDLLAALLVVAMLILVHASVAFEHARRPAAAQAWLDAQFQGSLGSPLAWLSPVVLAAGYALWHVHRALVRWRRRAATPPLDL